jgi:uncharacterized protein DUF5086
MTPNRSTTTAAAIAVFALLAGSALAQPLPIEVGTLKIRGTADQSRWVEVHKMEPWNGTQLFHVEVSGHKIGDPSWKVIHLVRHMAITEQALRRSVWRRSKELSVYPETFDGAYAAWKLRYANGQGAICAVSVEDCMKP